MKRYEHYPCSETYSEALEIFKVDLPSTITVDDVEKPICDEFPPEVVKRAQIIPGESSEHYRNRLLEIYPYKGQGHYITTLSHLCDIAVTGTHMVDGGRITPFIVRDTMELCGPDKVVLNKKYTVQLIRMSLESALIMRKRTDVYMDRLEARHNNSLLTTFFGKFLAGLVKHDHEYYMEGQYLYYLKKIAQSGFDNLTGMLNEPFNPYEFRDEVVKTMGVIRQMGIYLPYMGASLFQVHINELNAELARVE